RDLRLGTRSVTWGRDAIGLLHTYAPHVCLLGWRIPDSRVEEVVVALAMKRVKRQTRVLAYCGNTTRVEQGEDPEAFMKESGISAIYSKARGLRGLLDQCYELLQIDPPVAAPKKR